MFAFIPDLPFIRPVVVMRWGGSARFTLLVQRQGFLKVEWFSQCVRVSHMKLPILYFKKRSKCWLSRMDQPSEMKEYDGPCVCGKLRLAGVFLGAFRGLIWL